jgi:hypothetical protein
MMNRKQNALKEHNQQHRATPCECRISTNLRPERAQSIDVAFYHIRYSNTVYGATNHINHLNQTKITVQTNLKMI